MISPPTHVTLLWIDHCYAPNEGTFSIWVVPGVEVNCSDLVAREKGVCVLGSSADAVGGHAMLKNLEQVFQMLGIDVRHEETADD